MLKGIDPLLGGELLKILDEMGHGDQLALVDRNYPAVASGRPVVRLGPTDVVRAATALLRVFPLDEFVERPVERMEVYGDPARTTPVQEAVLKVAQASHPVELQWGIVPREAFYDRVRRVYAVVHVLEDQPWSCFILQKGVVFPE